MDGKLRAYLMRLASSIVGDAPRASWRGRGRGRLLLAVRSRALCTACRWVLSCTGACRTLLRLSVLFQPSFQACELHDLRRAYARGLGVVGLGGDGGTGRRGVLWGGCISLSRVLQASQVRSVSARSNIKNLQARALESYGEITITMAVGLPWMSTCQPGACRDLVLPAAITSPAASRCNIPTWSVCPSKRWDACYRAAFASVIGIGKRP